MRESRYIEPKLHVFQDWIKSHSVGIFDYITDILNNSVSPHSIVSVAQEK